MKTVTDVNTVNQLLTYSKQAEAGIHQKQYRCCLEQENTLITTVSVSSAFLQKCMNGPEKAKYLEENRSSFDIKV